MSKETGREPRAQLVLPNSTISLSQAHRPYRRTKGVHIQGLAKEGRIRERETPFEVLSLTIVISSSEESLHSLKTFNVSLSLGLPDHPQNVFSLSVISSSQSIVEVPDKVPDTRHITPPIICCLTVIVGFE